MRGLRRALRGRSLSAMVVAVGLGLAVPQLRALADLGIPCPQLLSGVACQIAPLPPAPAPVLPHLGPAPATAPSRSPGSTAQRPSGPAMATGSLTPISIGEDPALAAQVSNIIAHPVSSQRPVLLHFRLGGPARPPAPERTVLGIPTSTKALTFLTGAVIVALLAATIVILRLTRRSRSRRSGQAARTPGTPTGMASLPRRTRSTDHLPPGLRLLRNAPRTIARGVGGGVGSMATGISDGATALASGGGRVLRSSRVRPPRLGPFLALRTPLGALTPALILGSAALVAASGTLIASSRGTQPTIASSRIADNPPDLASAQAPAVVRPTWAQLVTIEREMANQRSELVKQENQVTQLSRQLHQQGEGVKITPQLPAELARLVALHQTTANALESNLQREFDLFAGVATNPLARDALMSTAESTGHPDVQAAVAYNLSLIEAELNQEAQIRAAEAAAAVSNPTSTIKRVAGRPVLIGPVGGPIAQCFGPSGFSAEPAVESRGQFFPHFHTGIDIDGPMGGPVHAAADGVVIVATSSVDAAGQLNGYGNYVVISHGGGFSTLYAHLQNETVRVGQHVSQGQVIGHEGSTGNSTGPHVHFETRVNGAAVNPIPYLGQQVRGC